MSRLQSLVTFGPSPGTVGPEGWTHDPAEGIAGYKMLDAEPPVTSVSLTARFPRRRAGSVALVLAHQDWSRAGEDWSASVHLVVSRSRWHLSYYGNKATRPTYARGLFAPFLRPGEDVVTKVIAEAGRAVVLLPSGREVRVEHGLIAPTRYAIVELFTKAGEAPALITAASAS